MICCIIQLNFNIKRYYSSILQEPESSECFLSDMSNEGNSKRTKFLDLPFSFRTTPLVPMVHGDHRMHFSSPNTTDNHVVDSSSIQSHESNYINLNLTI